MKVYLNSIQGIDDAITTMYFSKRTWTKELEDNIRDVCDRLFNRRGFWLNTYSKEDRDLFNKTMESLIKFGWMHITMLRFVDFSITVEGLHRAGQDDWDSHTKRYENRIIRSSTRLAEYNENEISDYYKDKIIPTDIALAVLGINTPETLEHNGKKYVKTVNGYILEEMKDNKDVKRGLYMLSIPSNFIFKVNLTEWAHVYKERNIDGTANPEVKECCESIQDQIENVFPWFDRNFLKKVKN